MMISTEKIFSPKDERIFVFGSNMAGRHGKGAALHALKHYGASTGVGIGHIGRSYAIPTKDYDLKVLSLDQIEHFVNGFLLYSSSNPSLQFNVTQIGCGLAGYKPEQIAPMFNVPPSARANLWFDKTWQRWLEPGPTNFWEGPI